jgi:tripartite-type tricarboxylate transporter receptor subunit TctC
MGHGHQASGYTSTIKWGQRIFLGFWACVFSVVLYAQSYPTKSIRLVVGYPAGGATDIAARTVAQKLSDAFSLSVIVDNRPGAASNLGAEMVARAAPDGYTLFLGSVSMAINPSLYAKLTYDPIHDFVAVAHVASTPFLLVVHPSVPIKSVKELISYVKAHPGQVNYATAGKGSGGHLFMELFASQSALKMVRIDYRGAAAATTDVLSGQVPMMFDNIFTTLPLSRSGKFRALAVSTIQRSPIAPDIPTVSESGLSGYDANAWFGLFAPSATPREIVARLNAEVVKGLQTSEMKERLRTLGASAGGGSAESFASFFQEDTKKWARVIKAASITPE